MSEPTEETTRERVDRLFDEALDRPLAARDSFLQSHCGDNPELRREVEAMLAHYATTTGALVEDDTSHELRAGMQAGAPPRIGSAEVLEVLTSDGPLVRWSTRRDAAPRDGVLVLARGSLTKAARRRLTYRAEVLHRAQHPALAQVLEMGSVEAGRGTEVFLLHEAVEGVTPQASAADSIAELRRLLERLSVLCQGLEELHRRGLFHGRVCGAVRLVDDGSFRLAEPGFAGLLAVLPPDGSEIAPLPGPQTPAPEWTALPGWELDSRVDIWAIGQMMQAAARGLEGPLAQQTSKLAERCLAGDRNARPRSGGALSDAIDRMLQEDSMQDELAFSPRSTVAIVIVCIVAAAAGFALGAILI
ncbi:MAG: hypothetical protein MK101_08125 [Phycisphaerales bacterium]|nr:hypothetical protein [Phycisphaerales bacterium]